MESTLKLICVCLGFLMFSISETQCFLSSIADGDRKMSSLSGEDLEYIRRVTRLADLKGTLLGEFIKGAQLPEISSITNLNLQKIVNSFMENKGLAEVTDMLINGRNLTQDAAYRECHVDYGEFVEPVTNNILNLVMERICANGIGLPITPLCSIWKRNPFPVKEKTAWGRKMMDAMAKIPEGIAEGKLHWVGGFDFCLEQKVNYTYFEFNGSVPEHRNFTGQYCRLALSSNRLMSQNVDLPLYFGVCVPDSCTKDHVATYITQDNILLSILLNEILNVTVTQVYCGQELDRPNDIPFQAGLGVLLCFLIIGILATIYDGAFRNKVVWRQKRKSKPDASEKVDDKELFENDKIGWLLRLELAFAGFSWYTNIRKIFNTQTKPDQLPVLNGIRYLTYVWVVLGNTYVFGPVYQECWVSANIVSALRELPKKFVFQVVINYHLNTDSFLLISGVLISYWYLKRVERNNNKLSIRIIVHYILHRYWRLIPALMLTIMFYTCFYRYFADGPLFPQDVGDAGNCRINWWVDLLMVHNLVRTEYLCLTWMFYVPLIFQLHVAFLIVLIPLVIWPVVGYALLGAMFTAHIGATAAITMQYRMLNDAGGLFTGYYLVPWCRAGPAIVGLVIGIILHKTKCKVKMNVVLVVLGWICALGTLAAVVFSSYSQFKEGGEFWSDSANAAYDTLARTAWAVGLGWIVFACSTGHGGLIGRFLGWDLFLPLSRLVYITFCTSAMMIFRLVYTNRILLYVHDFHMMYNVLGHLIYVTLMGLFFGLLWHYPASIGIEKAVCCKTFNQWMMAARHPKELERDDVSHDGSDDGSDISDKKKAD